MAVDSMQIGYTDLRQLINIDPPIYDYENDEHKHKVDIGNAREEIQKPGSKQSSKPEVAEVSIQDEGGDADTAQVETTQKSPAVEPVPEEIIMDFEDEFDLRDEESWSAVPSEHVPGRFLQFRKLTTKKLQELEGNLETTVKKTTRKVQTLKAQFHEHKKRWESERIVLIEQIDQASELQNQAEKEADIAMQQLEEFINGQEELEQEEEEKRRGLETMTREPTLSLVEAEENLQRTMNEQSQAEQEAAERLLSQTDDAKAMSRKSTTTGEAAVEQKAGTPEAVRESSARSRASLREQHKSVLDNLRRSATERRAKSPAIDTGALARSELDSMELDEDGDMPFPPDLSKEERTMQDMGTSPIIFSKEGTRMTFKSDRKSSSTFLIKLDKSVGQTPQSWASKSVGQTPQSWASKSVSQTPLMYAESFTQTGLEEDEWDDIRNWKSIPVADHPIVQEYLKVYDTMVHFKEALSTFFMDREMMSLSQVLMDIEPVPFDKEDKVQPQVEEMTLNIANILEDTLQLVTSAISNDREYPVSSLLGGLSRDQTRSILFTRERTGVPVGPLPSRGDVKTAMSENLESTVHEKFDELQHQHDQLQQQHNALQARFKDESKKHEDQLNHNTVVMMEMQDTIHALQRELSVIGQKAQQFQARPQLPKQSRSVQVPDMQTDQRNTSQESGRSQTPIMFTRLDSERNAKMMKRAVNEERLPVTKYQTAVDAMDRYVDIPSRRMAHLAAKYVHHTQMKQIEDAVRRSSNLDESVFHVLDKMEALQNERAQRWADKMDALGNERLQLANFLMITLDEIERESGIFLIKPMFSYRAPSKAENIQGKLSRPYKPPRDTNVSQAGQLQNGLAPIPTPTTQARRSTVPSTYTPHPPARKTDDPADGVSGKQTELVGDYPHATWNPSMASPRYPEADAAWSQAQVNTPRILELDINRMLIGQNQISMNIPHHYLSKDRLSNAANLSTRTYATLSRPAGQETRGRSGGRPRSASKVSDSAPPTTPLRDDTPLSAGSATVKRVETISEKDDSAGTSRTIPATPPLPPITPREDNAVKIPRHEMHAAS